MCKGARGQKSWADSKELWSWRGDGRQKPLCRGSGIPLKALVHSQPSACALLSTRVPGAFLLDLGPRGSQTSEGLG